MNATRPILAWAVALLAAASLAAPALADGTKLAGGTKLIGNSALVRGGAPLPQFNTGFPIEIGNPDPVGAAKSDLEISLTAPDHSVLHFLFSPRSLVGTTPSFGMTPGASYSGVAWNLFDNDKLFGSVALSSAVKPAQADDPTSRIYGPLISLHSTFELGYAFDPRQSLSFDVDHANPAPYFGDRAAAGENLRLQYGVHF